MFLKNYSKKSLLISGSVLVSFFIIFLSICYSVYGNNVSFDKYGDFYSDCKIESKLSSINMVCNSLLEGIEKRENGAICLRLLILPGNNNQNYIMVCEEAQKILGVTIEDITVEGRLPVELSFVYNRSLFKEARFKSLHIKVLSDSESTPLIRDLLNRGWQTNNIVTRADLEIKRKGYYTQPFDLPGLENLSLLLFTDVNVLDKSFKDGKMLFDLKISALGSNFTLTTDAKTLAFYSLGGDIDKLLEAKDIDLISLDKEYSAGFLYIQKDSSVNVKKLMEVCKKYDERILLLHQFCISDFDLESLFLEEDIDEYLAKLVEKRSSAAEKLMFVILQPYEED